MERNKQGDDVGYARDQLVLLEMLPYMTVSQQLCPPMVKKYRKSNLQVDSIDSHVP